MNRNFSQWRVTVIVVMTMRINSTSCFSTKTLLQMCYTTNNLILTVPILCVSEMRGDPENLGDLAEVAQSWGSSPEDF